MSAIKKVFLTGASGYIGGDALYALQEAQPTWEISILVRSEEQGQMIQEVLPKVKLVVGALDDFELVKDAASKADVVIHTADSSDHQVSARAISAGLRSSHSASNPGYYVHIGGTGILCWYDSENNRYGEAPLQEHSYNDLEGVDAVLSLPDCAFHRDVDKIVLADAALDPEAVKTAIVCPPTIYGAGRGALNQRSRQIPMMIATTLEEGYGPVAGPGLAEWNNVHVHDLSDLIVLLASRAALSEPSSDEKEIWGPRAYYFAENGTHKWSKMAEIIAQEAHKQGLIGGAVLKVFPLEVARNKGQFDWISWGLNSKGEARRARKYLGWAPKSPSLPDSIPDMVQMEAARRK